MKLTKYSLLALLIILLALLLRCYRLGEIPQGLYWDEIAMYLDSKVVAQSSFDIHQRPWFQLIYPSYGDYKLSGYLWLSALSFKIFGPGDWQLRLISSLAGLMSVITAAFLMKELFLFDKNKSQKFVYYQLAAMMVIATSVWSILFSRTAFEGHLAQVYLSISLLFLLKSRRQKTCLYLLISTFFAVLSTYTYFSVRFVYPGIFLLIQLLSCNCFSLKLKLKQNYRKIFFYILLKIILPLLLFYLCLLPMLNSPLYEVSNRFRLGTDSIFNFKDYALEQNSLREIAGNSLFDRLIFHRKFLLIKELASNYSDHLNFNYLFFEGDENLRHSTTQHGLFLWPFFLPFIMGFYALAANNKRVLVILIFWWLFALLPASVPETTPHSLRSLNALMPLSLIIAYGLGFWVNRVFNHKKIFERVLFFSFCLLISLSLFQFYRHYLKHYPRAANEAWQGQYRELALAINRYSDKQVYLQPFDDKFYLWLLSYSDTNAQEIQALAKENYVPISLPGISYGLPDPASLSSGSALIAGPKKAIDTWLVNNGGQLHNVQYFKSFGQEERFILGEW